ncbi:MAG: hypothetical protein NC221_07170 [Duncaniella sp.]|nr:hypothetical protein [Duncaniella sp.]
MNRFRQILLAFNLIGSLLAAAQAPARDYAVISAKAERFFKYAEWANAAAMYELMIEDSATLASNYSNAIVVAGMRSLPDYQISVFERSQTNLVPMAKVLDGVRAVSFSLGNAPLYENFLHLLLQRQPWLGRSIDRRLLDYYIFRKDADGIVKMSELMLSTAPGNIGYLSALAQGLMLKGDYSRAVDTYQLILATDPDNVNALLNLGNYFALNNRPDKALPYLSRANLLSPSPYLAQLISSLSAMK